MKKNIYIEFYGEQVPEEDLLKTAGELWDSLGNRAEDLRKVNLYVKPEDNRVYCVFNDELQADFPILSDSGQF